MTHYYMQRFVLTPLYEIYRMHHLRKFKHQVKEAYKELRRKKLVKYGNNESLYSLI